MKDFFTSRYVAIRTIHYISLFAGFMFLMATPVLANSSPALLHTSQPTHAATSQNVSPEFEPAEGVGTSANWAGYVAEGDTYTGVYGSWIVPTVSPETEHDIAADTTWVGIGGFSSRDLIQAGTQAIVYDGRVEYQAWYEMLPDYQIRIPLRVQAGDSVTVSLSHLERDQWQLTFANNTTGQTYQKVLTYDSSFSSAEWIQEMPIGSNGRVFRYLPLSDFGSVTFMNAGAVVNGVHKTIGEADAKPVTMVSASRAIATPSVMDENGSGFTVARTDTPIVDLRDEEVLYLLWSF